MAVVFKKKPTLHRRMRKVSRELDEVHDSIRELSEVVEDGGVKVSLRAERAPISTSSRNADAAVKEMGRRIRDERFSDYLSSSFKPSRPLKHERRVQRNKAVVMLCCVLIVLFWVVYRMFV